MNICDRMKKRIALVAALATLLTIGGCNMGVGISASVPAPWGYVNVGTSTNHRW